MEKFRATEKIRKISQRFLVPGIIVICFMILPSISFAGSLGGSLGGSLLYSSSGIFGFRYGTLPSQGFGYWGEFKLNAPSHSPSYETISRRTVETVFQDPFREETLQYFNVSAGASYALTDRFWIDAGLGWAVRRPWRKYFDSTGILGGNPGEYWIRDDDRNSINVILGVSWVFRRTESSMMILNLGVETQPKGVVIGIGWGL